MPDVIGRESTHIQHRVNLRGLSISQPRNWRGHARIPCFSGFFAVFLEIAFSAVADGVNYWWVYPITFLDLVVSPVTFAI